MICEQNRTQVHVLLFDEFETLDAFGPVEVLADVEGYEIRCVSVNGGTVKSAQGISVETEPLKPVEGAVLLVPGGQGTRPLVKDELFLNQLRQAADVSSFCLTVCTGAALAAACGLLDGRSATSNKKAFDWVRSVSRSVVWQPCARWVADGKFYTSSGVSAGMDMALGFVSDQFGREKAERIAEHIEYLWNDNWEEDPFAVELLTL